ncbi:MAG: hypothetical protein VR68_05975 [Peptococcaceae bacterium BRH_c4a]|nr:MAG: hypothetical protein VR68_05975 [Peptococcaceae bacterium BRH_c4a]
MGIALTQQACWDQREVEKLGIVLATGVEQASGGRVRIIVQNINPSAMGKSAQGGGPTGTADKPYRNRVAEGDTIFQANRKISLETSRQLFYAHNQIIIISEELARSRGILEVMDFFERNPQIRRTTWIVIGKGDLAALLDEPGRLETTPAQRIFSIINERDLSSQYGIRTLGNFLEMLGSESLHPFTAVIERTANPAKPEKHKNKMSEGHISEPHDILKINGTAVFRRDKMVGWLNPKESRGLLWIRGEVKGGSLEVTSPEEKGKTVTLEILRSKTRLQPRINDGQILMTVEIKEESNLVETAAKIDLTKPEIIKKLEKLQAGAIREEVESALNKVQQEYGADVFGFGEEIHRQYPRQWKEMKKNWSDLFPAVQVEVLVETKIRRTGLITKPVEPKQQ